MGKADALWWSRAANIEPDAIRAGAKLRTAANKKAE
jgi:hypothetical protein